jgi:DNA-binding LacI/PurR family transcriptional regulator
MDAYGTLKSRMRKFLLDQIDRGLLKPGQHIPSVRHLSRNLAVSTSVAFQTIRELKAERILEQSPNGRHVVSKDLTSAHPTKKLRLAFSSCGSDHIRHTIYQSIYNYLLAHCRPANNTLDCLLELNDTWSPLAPDYYDALIVADWKPQNADKICHGPCIGLDSWEGVAVDCVVRTDHHKGGELAGLHLRRAGRKRVAYWDIIKEKSQLLKGMTHRRLGFMKGWIDGGGDLEEVVYLPVICGKDELRPLVAEVAKKVDTFFCFSDQTALNIADILQELGVRIPDDIALMGYDGTYEALKYKPSLTTICQPCREIAAKVMELITASDARALDNQEILISPVLIKGGST